MHKLCLVRISITHELLEQNLRSWTEALVPRLQTRAPRNNLDLIPSLDKQTEETVERWPEEIQSPGQPSLLQALTVKC